MDKEDRRRLDDQIADEYRITYERATAANATIQSLRGWLVAGLGAGLGLADNWTWHLSVFAAALIVTVWYNEAATRSVQARLLCRIEHLEQHFAGTRKIDRPYQTRTVTTGWARGNRKYKLAVAAMLGWDVTPFYIVMLSAPLAHIWQTCLT